MIGHADRVGPLRDYCLGLLMPGERKSVEPMAAVTAPARVAAQHQSLLHFVGNAPGRTSGFWPGCATWCCRRLNAGADRGVDHRRYRVSEEGPAFGRGSAAVLRPARQAGQLPGGGHPVDRQPLGQLADRLPAVSAAGMDGRCRAPGPGRGAGSDIAFPAKPDIALDQIRAARAAGVPPGVVLMRCRLRQRHPAAYRDRRARPVLYRRHPAACHGLAARGGAVAGETLVGRGRPPTRLAAIASTSRSRPRSSRSACSKRAWQADRLGAKDRRIR